MVLNAIKITGRETWLYIVCWDLKDKFRRDGGGEEKGIFGWGNSMNEEQGTDEGGVRGRVWREAEAEASRAQGEAEVGSGQIMQGPQGRAKDLDLVSTPRPFVC